MNQPAFKIPVSTYQRFIRESNRRLGQSFYDFIKAEKMTTDKEWLNKLYNTTDSIAGVMIASVIDYTQ